MHPQPADAGNRPKRKLTESQGRMLLLHGRPAESVTRWCGSGYGRTDGRSDTASDPLPNPPKATTESCQFHS
jgi:hypothetical protein